MQHQMKQQIKKCKHTIFDKHCDYCQSLQQKWTEKLNKSGFKDIERDDDSLKIWSSWFRHMYSVEEFQAKQAYYQMASSFLNEYPFENKIQATIWDYHTNGIGVREIANLLKSVRVKTNRTTVWQIIKRLQARMYDMYMLPVKAYHE